MRLILLGGLLIMMPAMIVVLYFWGSVGMFPAMASIFVASLPFVGLALAFQRIERRGKPL